MKTIIKTIALVAILTFTGCKKENKTPSEPEPQTQTVTPPIKIPPYTLRILRNGVSGNDVYQHLTIKVIDSLHQNKILLDIDKEMSKIDYDTSIVINLSNVSTFKFYGYGYSYTIVSPILGNYIFSSSNLKTKFYINGKLLNSQYPDKVNNEYFKTFKFDL